MNPQPSARFIHGLMDNLTFWQGQTENLSDDRIRELIPDHGNMLRAIKMGLLLPDTQPAAARLATQLYRFIERGGYWTAWLAVLARAEQCLPSIEAELRFRLLALWGRLLRYDRKLTKAVTLHQTALELAQSLDDPLALGEAHYCLSADYRLQHAYEQAEFHGQQALTIFEAESATFKIMEVMNTLGAIAFQKGDLETAVKLQRQAVTLARQKSVAPTLTARFLTNLGGTLHQDGRHTEALTCLQEAGALLKPTASDLDKVRCANQRGIIYYNLKRYHDAEQEFRYILTLLRTQPNAIFLQAEAQTNLGNALYLLDQFDEARKWLQRSLQSWGQAEDDVQTANSMNSLAELYIALGDNLKAQAFYFKALALLDQYPQNILADRIKAECQVGLKLLGEQN